MRLLSWLFIAILVLIASPMLADPSTLANVRWKE